MLIIRLSQSCCRLFDVACHTPINVRHCSAFPTLWRLGGPAAPSEAPPGMAKKYRKKRIKNSTRRLFVPGVPFFVSKSTRPTCIHLQKNAFFGTLGPAVGRHLGTGTQSIPAVPVSRSRNRHVQPRGEASSLVNISGGDPHLTQHC